MANNVLILVYFVLLFCIILLCGTTVYYQMLYHEAIEQGAEDIVIALEMVTACQQLSNVTTDEIEAQYIKTFLLNEDGSLK